MMQKNSPKRILLRKSLVNVLQSDDRIQDIAEQQEVVNALLVRLADEASEHLSAFAEYLEKQCALQPKIVAVIVQKLMAQPNARHFLGKKLSHLWLLFKVYQAMDIHKNTRGSNENRRKRQAVTDFFIFFHFKGSSLRQLLQACCNAVKQCYDDDMVEFIAEGKETEVQEIFISDYEDQKLLQEISDSRIEEELINLITDYIFLHDSSLEKVLQRQIILAYLQKHRIAKTSQVLRPFAQLKSDMAELKAFYIQQNSTFSPEIKKVFELLENKKFFNCNLYDVLCQLKRKTLLIDILELERLIMKVNNSKKLIQEKDAILVIGNSGSGKTTCILKFLGYTLKAGKYDNLTTLIPIEPLQVQHKKIYTSPEAMSCTRCINPVLVPHKMYKLGTNKNKMTFVICDTPGFGDSAGVEVDIANGVGMIKALREARSMRVVVLLPYESITNDRMHGVIQIGEVISNLFHQLTAMDSIAIYFNRVPVNKIVCIPEIIENKIKYLNQFERSNKVLAAFLKNILKQSLDKNNYIDPLVGDFKAIFNSLVLMPPITNVKYSLRYDFAELTKMQIDKFIQNESRKIKDSFIGQKYKIAQFHLLLLQKLTKILSNNDRIKSQYYELTRLIKQESINQLIHFENLVTQIVNCRDKFSIKDKIKETKEKIIELDMVFSEFQGLKVVSSDKIRQIVQQNKQKMLMQFNNLSEITNEAIFAVKSFSLLLDNSIEREVINIIEKNFNDLYQEIKKQIKYNNYSQMRENLKIMANLAAFNSQLSQQPAINNLDDRLKDLKIILTKEVNANFTYISSYITKDTRITENAVKEVNVKIENIKNIQALQFLDNNTEVHNKLSQQIKMIETKCKRIIRELQSLRLTLSQEALAKDSIEKDQLIFKKNQIELLMRIQSVKQNLSDDYQYAKQIIARKLEDNVKILKKYIVALKGNKNQEIFINLQSIKRATMVVMQFSKIVEDFETSSDMALQIQREFINYLNGEIMTMRLIELKLCQISQENLVKIRFYHRKIESHSQMCILGPEICDSIKELQSQFIQKLTEPFLQFKQKQILSLQQKKHYKYLIYTIEKLQKLSLYTLQIEEIISPTEYSIIKEYENDINQCLKIFCRNMEIDIETFIESETKFQSNTVPTFLKDLIKTLFAITMKTKFTEYLVRKLYFESFEKLRSIQVKLHEIYDQMKMIYRESHTHIEDQHILLTWLKFYCQIQEIYKFRGGTSQLGFKNLQKQCQEEFAKSLKNDQEQIREMIVENKPSKINFAQLQRYYNNFLTVKGLEGIRRRRVMTNQLQKVQMRTLQNLKQFMKQMDEIIFINKIDDFIQAFYEAVVLEKNLKRLYTLEEDKLLIFLKQSDITKIGNKIINVFQSEFNTLSELLKNYDFININQKLKVFGSLENIIYEVFNLDNELQMIDYDDTPGNLKDEVYKMLLFINDNANTLKALIESHEFINENKVIAKNTKKLKNLLEILKNGILQESKSKYDNFTANFIIDSDFERYYLYSNERKRLDLKINIDLYMKNMYNQYKENYNRYEDLAKTIQRKIEQIITMLPTQLKPYQSYEFQKLKMSLTSEDDDLITKVSKSIISNPMNLDIFFSQAYKSKKNGKIDLHSKWVNKLEQIYSQQQQKTASVDQRITFIQTSFIDVYYRHKEYLKNDKLMIEVLEKKYRYWLNILLRSGVQFILNLESMLNCTAIKVNEEKKAANYRGLLLCIFKIYNFIFRLKDDGIIDHNNIRQKIAESYENKLDVIINWYKETIKNMPREKLYSKEMQQITKMKKIENNISEVSLAGEVIDLIKSQLEKTQIQSQKYSSLFNSINSVQPYLPALEFYEKQIEEMLKFLKTFQFYSEIKRNMTTKQIEEDLSQLDCFYEILESKKEFFQKHIIKKNHNIYDMHSISNNLASKLESNAKDAHEDVSEIFKNINGEPSERVNLLIMQLKIILNKERQVKFISKDRLKDIYEKISKLLKISVENNRYQCKRTLDIAQLKLAQVLLNVKAVQQKSKEYRNNEEKKYKKIIDETIRNIKKKYYQQENASQNNQNLNDALKTEIETIKIQLTNQKNQKIKQINDQSDKEVKRQYDSLTAPINDFVIFLIQFQRGLIDIDEVRNKYNKYLNDVLEQLQKMSPKLIKLVQNGLFACHKDDRLIGKVILTSSNVFTNFSASMINKLTRDQDISYVLRNLEKISLNGKDKISTNQINSIERNFKQFKAKYEQYKNHYQRIPTKYTISYIITTLKDLGNTIKTQFYQNRNPVKQPKNKIQLIAGIFALWTILNAEAYDGEYFIQPHPTNIVTLILLLGFSNSSEMLSNRLVQVAKGQGKSIVIAGLSCYLALTGFNVRCAGHSSYMKTRDMMSFNILFERLEVENNIKYGTLYELCEDLVINKNGLNLNNQVEKILIQRPSGFMKKSLLLQHSTFNFGKDTINNPTILLINQVDELFDEFFFGRIYCPNICLHGPIISRFIQLVWREVQKNGEQVDPQDLIHRLQFKQLIERYPNLQQILKNQVHGMVAGALNFKHEYYIIDKRIAYKDYDDSFSFKMNYGYKTIFANLYEHEKGHISKPYLDEALRIRLNIAVFSYAVLPNYFCNIIGVSSTLSVLQRYKKVLLSQHYNIKNQYSVPSIFGFNKKIIQDYTLTSTDSYYQCIISKIKKIQNYRPIIIFFERSSEVMDFLNSTQYIPFRNRTNALTQQHDEVLKQNRITKAVNPGIITLMSRCMGRGTDFILMDERIKEGLHVIQAFLSLKESEEAQIKGLTARQGLNGSYDCIIREYQLEQLNLTKASIPHNAHSTYIHNILMKAREERLEKQQQMILSHLNEQYKRHLETVQIYSNPKLIQEDLINYILKKNFHQIKKIVNIKAVLGIDATGSMSAALNKACEIISSVFEQIYTVLQKQKIKATIEMKIMVYRNYNSSCEEIIESTAFERTPVELKKFLAKVSPKGGWGNEALEVLFQRLNREDTIDQVILIGDAAPNTKAEVSKKRVTRGEKYWNDKGFPLTHIDKELEFFKLRKCPVNSFYLNDGKGFKEISAITGGAAEKFNINSINAAQSLLRFIIEILLKSIKKAANRDLNLLETYRKMFK